VIVEAKRGNEWAKLTRQAIGQLYEYRYFQVVSSNSRLIFLASEAVPETWQRYLEDDREIGVVWPASGDDYFLTRLARQALGVSKRASAD